MENRIEVDVDDLPDIFDITLAGEDYIIRIDYNEVADFYSITIMKDEVTLLTQEPLRLNCLVGYDIPNEDLPRVDLKVMDATGEADDAGQDNFENSVFIYLDERDPNGSEDINPTAEPLGYDPEEDDDDESDEEVSI